MAIQMKLGREDNFLYKDLLDAYWCIENIFFSNSNGESICSFEFNAYPSREAKYKNKQLMQERTIPYGGSGAGTYETVLHSWQGEFRTSLIFSGGIPLTEVGQKDVLYEFVKEYLELIDYLDVLEE